MDDEKRGRGRPKSEHPKRHQVKLNLDDRQFELLTDLVYRLGMVKSDVYEVALERLYDEIMR